MASPYKPIQRILQSLDDSCSFCISEASSGLKNGAAETCKANKCLRNDTPVVELFQIWV